MGRVAAADSSLALRAVSADGSPLEASSVRASIERTPPSDVGDPDPDALRFLVVGTGPALPLSLRVTSFDVGVPRDEEAPLDRLTNVPLAPTACPTGAAIGAKCAETPPVRAVTDALDRDHPLARGRSIRATLGGTLEIATPDGKATLDVPVGSPRALAASVRVHVMRVGPGGAAPIGTSDADAIARVRAEIGRASAVFSQCGFDFGDADDASVEIVDPPPPHLLAVGCDAGAPASGGAIRLDVDGRLVEATVPAGTLPRGAARIAAAAIEKAGFRAVIFDEKPAHATTYPPTDISVRRKNGALATLATHATSAADGARIAPGHASTDATLDVCIGSVALDDGLDHFIDATAVEGSLEERTLLRAFDTGDPSIIEVFLIPSFGGAGRIGESFLFADRGSIRNVVIVDRMGIRAAASSFTLAHELGHVLLDQTGHPDDVGIEMPTRLMDAAASNGTAFGPRRLTVDECKRALDESGPTSPHPLLVPRVDEKKKPVVPRR